MTQEGLTQELLFLPKDEEAKSDLLIQTLFRTRAGVTKLQVYEAQSPDCVPAFVLEAVVLPQGIFVARYWCA